MAFTGCIQVWKSIANDGYGITDDTLICLLYRLKSYDTVIIVITLIAEFQIEKQINEKQNQTRIWNGIGVNHSGV